MSIFTITSDEIKDIHNGLWALDHAIATLEGVISPSLINQLRKAKVEIQNGAKSAQEQKYKYWDRLNAYFEEQRTYHKYISVWSIYDIELLSDTAFELEKESVLVHENFSVPLPAGRVSWFDMWKAADEAISAVGGDHIFIESFTRSSINPKIIFLGTGS